MKLTFSYDGKSFSDYYSEAANDHYQTTLGNLDNNPLAIGSASTRNNFVEAFDFVSNTWITQSAFSFCSMEWVFIILVHFRDFLEFQDLQWSIFQVLSMSLEDIVMVKQHPVFRCLRQIHGLKLITSNKLDLGIDQLQLTIASMLSVDIMHICTFLFPCFDLQSLTSS